MVIDLSLFHMQERIESSVTQNGDGTATVKITAHLPNWLINGRTRELERAAREGRLVILKDGDEIAGYAYTP